MSIYKSFRLTSNSIIGVSKEDISFINKLLVIYIERAHGKQSVKSLSLADQLLIFSFIVYQLTFLGYELDDVDGTAIQLDIKKSVQFNNCPIVDRD